MRTLQDSEADKFIEELALEVHKRLKAVGMKGRCVTLKVSPVHRGLTAYVRFTGNHLQYAQDSYRDSALYAQK